MREISRDNAIAFMSGFRENVRRGMIDLDALRDVADREGNVALMVRVTDLESRLKAIEAEALHEAKLIVWASTPTTKGGIE